jgi:hypothetical protein
MKKVRRFNGEDDSYVEGTASSLADDANDQFRQDQTERMARIARGESGNAPAALTSRSMPRAAEAPAAPAAAAEAPAAKSEGFGSAFSKARAKALEGGPSTFVWAGDGKRYGTDLKKPAASTSPSSPPAAAPKADTPKADTPVERGLPAKSSKEQSLAVAQIPLDDKRTPVKGESASGSELGRNVSNTLSALPISRGIQAAQSGAKLAGRKAVEEFVKKDPNWRNKELEILKDIPKLLGGPKKQLALPAPPSKLALPAPPKRLPYDRPAASAAESTKAKLAGELRRGAQPTKFTSPSKSTASKKTRKFNEDEGGVEFRRGGSVSSASKRADGCAIRGKTRA